MNSDLIFEKAVCFGYRTRVFSVERDAGTVSKSATRKVVETQEVIHKSRIAPLNSMKQEAFRMCRQYGTKFELLGLWIVPIDDADKLSEGLLDISNRWETWCTDELIPNYPIWVQQYAVANPTETADILRLAPSLDDIKENTRFSFARIALSSSSVNAINLESEVEGLWGQVLKDIASELKDANMHKSQTFTQEGARAVLGRIVRKCEGLGFLHPRLHEISDTIRAVLATLPTTGAIKDIHALAVRSIIDALMDTNEFARRGFGVSDNEPVQVVAADDPLPAVDSFTGMPIETGTDATSNPVPAANADVRTAPVNHMTDDDGELSLDDVFKDAPASTPELGPDPVSRPAAAPEEALAIETDFSGW
jgi:hypothetical protein